ncbi:MAG: molybdopterin-binding protein [Kiritimatiellae bacterium]|nr:molybdopterin-binding protein [Kiritimatiellia bacterium]
MKKEVISSFGLVIVGNEILDCRCRDAHFAHAAHALASRSLALRYAMILPDDPQIVLEQLRWCMARPEPFFCCGGIGATPDDYTRQCAAQAAGVPLEMHPEGEVILRRRFGKAATPARLEMVRFPKGAVLIPNPVNQVPGFRINRGHFLPGFPEMAAPMMDWVLDTWYEAAGSRVIESVLLPGAREGDLVPLMNEFVKDHPAVTFSSLPRFTPAGTEVELGVSGEPEAVNTAMQDLLRRLDAHAIPHHAPRTVVGRDGNKH